MDSTNKVAEALSTIYSTGLQNAAESEKVLKQAWDNTKTFAGIGAIGGAGIGGGRAFLKGDSLKDILTDTLLGGGLGAVGGGGLGMALDSMNTVSETPNVVPPPGEDPDSTSVRAGDIAESLWKNKRDFIPFAGDFKDQVAGYLAGTGVGGLAGWDSYSKNKTLRSKLMADAYTKEKPKGTTKDILDLMRSRIPDSGGLLDRAKAKITRTRLLPPVPEEIPDLQGWIRKNPEYSGWEYPELSRAQKLVDNVDTKFRKQRKGTARRSALSAALTFLLTQGVSAAGKANESRNF